MAWVLNDPPPRYGEELAECQRYQLLSGDDTDTGSLCALSLSHFSNGGTYRCFLPTPVTLRGTPVIIGTPFLYSVATDQKVNGGTVSIHSVQNNGVLLDVTGVSQPVYVWFANRSGVDCNL